MWGNLNATVQHNASGGFLNDSNISRRENSKRVENVIPIMIKHITQSNNDLQLWGMTVHMITFVAIVRNIGNTSTKMTYEFEDETGFRWLERMNRPDTSINLNSYVRVYGHIKEQNETKYVLALKILPLTKLNELTTHLLEVSYVTLRAEKMFNIEKERTGGTATNDVLLEDNNISGLTKEQALVFKAIQAENDSENGIERRVLKTRIPQNILPYVDDIINFLTSEGHIYTTLTDDHFKTT
ncbi:replication protein A 32 kDa subunit-like isoform X2 [Megachile rotundata]|uniref:replication protein A 32 kDa subunit-like isoform X2 n=1 Tax=Megachile rotundata TaxID=143995 RepID=UPI003FD68C5C